MLSPLFFHISSAGARAWGPRPGSRCGEMRPILHSSKKINSTHQSDSEEEASDSSCSASASSASSSFLGLSRRSCITLRQTSQETPMYSLPHTTPPKTNVSNPQILDILYHVLSIYCIGVSFSISVIFEQFPASHKTKHLCKSLAISRLRCPVLVSTAYLPNGNCTAKRLGNLPEKNGVNFRLQQYCPHVFLLSKGNCICTRK